MWLADCRTSPRLHIRLGSRTSSTGKGEPSLSRTGVDDTWTNCFICQGSREALGGSSSPSIGVPSGRRHVEALLALKSSVDPFESLQWKGTNVCAWKGIKECLNERVTKLVLEHLNLSGSLDEQSLNRLDQFRVLSFKTNSISGQIPDLSSLVNLKSLFLNESNFRRIPRIGSPVEFQLLYSNSDELKGTIPPLNQTGLRFFNVSNNQLHGQISVTQDLVRFNISSFSAKGKGKGKGC
ncbi:hypothetical protein V6N11_069013 [Hibiscus sabdariffa]|uniref:Leucine-rich repeat-containing N-terminal plant-type domain-containing protein n=1 Tax=Hibiscus sabdariffa TaxID=183260 RepID=A0ABR1ZXQ8_9ROSI